MKGKKLIFIMALMVVSISAQAKFWGWDTEWTYTRLEGNCLVQYSIQHYYVFWIDVGDAREVEIGRNCTE